MANDKLLHCLVSALLVVLISKFLPMWVAALAVLVIGIAKEGIYDYLLKKGTPEWWDLLADFIGILVGLVLVV